MSAPLAVQCQGTMGLQIVKLPTLSKKVVSQPSSRAVTNISPGLFEPSLRLHGDSAFVLCALSLGITTRRRKERQRKLSSQLGVLLFLQRTITERRCKECKTNCLYMSSRQPASGRWEPLCQPQTSTARSSSTTVAMLCYQSLQSMRCIG